MSSLSPSNQLMLLSSCLNLNSEDSQRFTALLKAVDDWQQAVPHIIARQAGPLLYHHLNSCTDWSQLVPQTALSTLRQAWLKTLSRSMVLEQHFRQLAGIANAAGIEMIAMKGIYLSEHLYKKPGLRQYSDIDVLVREADGNRLVELLANAGYRSETVYLSDFFEKHSDKRRPVHYPPMIRNGVSVEVHCRLYDDESVYKNVDIDTLWAQAVDIALYGEKVKVFGPEHLLINLCLHLDKHFQGGEFQFTGFYDIVNLLAGNTISINYAALWETATQWQVKQYVQKHFAICERYFGLKLSAEQMPEPYKLSATEILLFEERVQGAGSKINFFERHGSELARFETPVEKFQFIWHYFFPSREFIRRRYHPRNNFHLLMYYPYRFWKAFTVVLSAVKGKF